MSFAQAVDRHLRLARLQLLAESPGYAANALVLGVALRDLGFHLSADQLRTAIAWLGEQGMVSLLPVNGGPTIATITERGHDVARGLSINPGIERPVPGT